MKPFKIRAHNHITNFFVMEKVSSLDDIRTLMIKVTCANLCEKAWSGQCKNCFFVPKSTSKSTKCKECKIKSNRENYERRRARRLLMKAKNEKRSRKNLKRKLSRSVTKVSIKI